MCLAVAMELSGKILVFEKNDQRKFIEPDFLKKKTSFSYQMFGPNGILHMLEIYTEFN